MRPLLAFAPVIVALASCGGDGGSHVPRDYVATYESGGLPPPRAYYESITIHDDAVTVTRTAVVSLGEITTGSWTFTLAFAEQNRLITLAARVDAGDADTIAPFPLGAPREALTLDGAQYGTTFVSGSYHVFAADVQAIYDAIQALPSAHGVPPPFGTG